MLNKVAWVPIGQITKCVGLIGHVKILSFCVDPENLVTYNPLLIEGFGKPVCISIKKIVQGNHLIGEIPYLKSREESQKIIGSIIHANKNKFPELPQQEFYYSDLQNCIVYCADEQVYGKVLGVYNFGAGDILEISVFKDDTSVMIHFTKKNFPLINVKTKRILMSSVIAY